MVYIEKLDTWINGSGTQKLSERGHLLRSISGGPKARYRKIFQELFVSKPKKFR